MASSTGVDIPSPDEVRRRIANYLATIQAIQAFVSLATWSQETGAPLAGSRYSIGRRMTTSTHNAVSPSREVTPDAVIQRDAYCGFVAEVKESLPGEGSVDHEGWRKSVNQLRRYDDDLVGWWTADERMAVMSLALLADRARSTPFITYLEDLLASGELRFQNPACVIGFTRSVGADNSLLLATEWGDVKDLHLSRRLRDGETVAVERVVANYGNRKFYDAEPIAEYVMIVLWNDVFNERQKEVEPDERLSAKPLHVTVADLTADLRRLYGSVGGERREQAFPRAKWVREALRAFVRLGLAVSTDRKGCYTVLFKPLHGDLVERFAKYRHPRKARKGIDESQLPLFEPPPQ